jgi:hypothetical protein
MNHERAAALSDHAAPRKSLARQRSARRIGGQCSQDERDKSEIGGNHARTNRSLRALAYGESAESTGANYDESEDGEKRHRDHQVGHHYQRIERELHRDGAEQRRYYDKQDRDE